MTSLYEPFETNKITVNWENHIFYNNYDSELALIVYRILYTVNNEINPPPSSTEQNQIVGGGGGGVYFVRKFYYKLFCCLKFISEEL